MRELILKMSVSLDGFVGSLNGGLNWIFETGDEKAREWTLKTIADAGLHIMGARTFCDMTAYWPTSTDVFAPPMNQIPKAVFSKQGAAILERAHTTAMEGARAPTATLERGRPQSVADSWGQAYVASGDLGEEIAKLKAQSGKPIIAHGGASFARSLVASGLIDQYALLVHPVALGQGLPLFAGLRSPKVLKLASSTAFPRGAVAQVYRPA